MGEPFGHLAFELFRDGAVVLSVEPPLAPGLPMDGLLLVVVGTMLLPLGNYGKTLGWSEGSSL